MDTTYIHKLIIIYLLGNIFYPTIRFVYVTHFDLGTYPTDQDIHKTLNLLINFINLKELYDET